ncbi:fish-egg lectin-like [Sinocyclocheilus grahami]|uniref:fish-egg lectin-like n=1 Tax=Sinocyclocheilus grahami TaxID=75366 RepID=UPI0007AC9431|nr:PREDICTED: fish-egg lectin-like [Sinocyclocheilus grahami]
MSRQSTVQATPLFHAAVTFPCGSFIQFPGLLKQVDAGGDQIIAGVNMNDDIFCLNMDANDKWPSSTTPWVQMNGKLKYYTCGPYSCWGVNSRTGVTLSNPVGTDWISMVACPNGHKHVSFDLGVLNPVGTDWISMVACPNGHKHVSFDLGVLWVVCVDGSIRKCTL